jgi:hypothetical protein
LSDVPSWKNSSIARTTVAGTCRAYRAAQA